MTAHERAIKSRWIGRCTVYTRTNSTDIDPATGRTKQTETAVVTDEPCRLSYASAPPAGDVKGAGTKSQGITLFIGKIDIPAGSKIVVTQNGVTQAYSKSGVPMVYTYHQAITLELWERWA